MRHDEHDCSQFTAFDFLQSPFTANRESRSQTPIQSSKNVQSRFRITEGVDVAKVVLFLSKLSRALYARGLSFTEYLCFLCQYHYFAFHRFRDSETAL